VRGRGLGFEVLGLGWVGVWRLVFVVFGMEKGLGSWMNVWKEEGHDEYEKRVSD